VRLLFLSDFHGRLPDISGWPADLVLAGGDYCEVDEIRRWKFEALSQKRPVREWPELAGRGRAESLVKRALAEGSAVVSGLAECGRPVLAIPGNSDRIALDWPALAGPVRPRPDQPQVEGRVTDLDVRIVVVGGVAFAGLGGWSGPANPQRLENDIAALREQWERLLAERALLGQAPPPLVLLSHNVPHGSSLDGVRNPDLPAFAQGQMVGSHRCRAALAALRPVLCLAGHLHENCGRSEVIDGTLCVCGAGAWRGAALLLDIFPDGRLSELHWVTARDGAPRLLAAREDAGRDT
jgi:Icc-related predicted phosphoesterase